MKKRTWIRSSLAVVLLLAVGCEAPNPGDVLFLGGNLALTSPPACEADASATFFLSSGFRDISPDLNEPLTAYGYYMAPQLINNTQTVSTNPVGYGVSTNVFSEENNIYIDGFNLCYEFPSNEPTVEPPPPCSELPKAPKAYAPALAEVLAGSEGVAVVDVLPPQVFVDDLGTQPAAGQQITVLVHLQATGRTTDGRVITSNEATYPIIICNGCLDSYPLVCKPQGEILDPTTVCRVGQDEAEGCVVPE